MVLSNQNKWVVCLELISVRACVRRAGRHDAGRRSTTYETNVVHIRHVPPRGASVPKRALIVSVSHRSNYRASIVFSSTLASRKIYRVSVTEWTRTN